MSYRSSSYSRVGAAFFSLLLLTVGGCANRVSVNNGFERLFLKSEEFNMPLTSAGLAYDRIEKGNATPSDIAAYNVAVTSLISNLNPAEFFSDGSGLEERLIEPPQAPIVLRFADNTEGADWNPSDFQSLVPSDFLKIKGIRSQTVDFGIGAPLVGRLSEERETVFTKTYGSYVPVTAVIDFDDTARVATVRLMDPLKDDEALLAGSERDLEVNYTTPIASALAARKRQQLNLPAMLNFEKFKSDLGGLTQVDRVYPEKLPVVFVHGLKSNPDTWRDVMNELRAYPEIRDRYEFWIFGYATGAPIPYTARRLRMDLEEMRVFRQKRGAPNDDVLLVGHSMGGILSRLMTQRSGDEEWGQMFNRPPELLDLPTRQRALLRELFYFEPLPYVNEVIFISTPHRGSDLATNPIGKLGANLIQLPANLIDLSGNLLQSSLAALTPEGRELLAEIPNSIQDLSTSSEFMRIRGEKPLNPNVTYHSIIGDRGKPGPLEESSDGIVPYWSAHREEAVSELIVPTHHGAHTDPRSIEEIARILVEH